MEELKKYIRETICKTHAELIKYDPAEENFELIEERLHVDGYLDALLNVQNHLPRERGETHLHLVFTTCEEGHGLEVLGEYDVDSNDMHLHCDKCGEDWTAFNWYGEDEVEKMYDF